jgi:hypothetical protein
MAVECPSYYQGQVARFTRLDSCGRPVYGPGNQVVTDGFISVKLSPEVDTGDDITAKKANGNSCVSVQGKPILKFYNTEIVLCEVDPTLVGILNPTWEPVCDEDGDTVGFDAVGDLDTTTGYAMELWMGVQTDTDSCSGDSGAAPSGYLLVPWNVGGVIGDIEIAGDAISFTFNGTTKRKSKWGRGPYGVQMKAGAPGRLLKPIGARTDFRQFVTTAPPPEPACGAQPVDRLPAEPAELSITRVADGTVRVKVDNHGSGPVTIDWGETPIVTTVVADGASADHVYAVPGAHVITVTDNLFPATGTVTRTVTTPLTPGTDLPVIAFAAVADPDDPDNGNCVSTTVTLGKWAVRTALEAVQNDSCQVGSGLLRPDVYVDFGDGTKPVPVRLDPATGIGTIALHCYPRAGYFTVKAWRDDNNNLRSTGPQQVPATFSVAGVEQSRTDDTVTMEFTATQAPASTVVFDFGDGTTPVVAAATDGVATATHTYTRL